MMVIKFERFADNYMCKDYFYSIWKSSEELGIDDRYNTLIKVTMTDYEFEQLFKDMVKELGYSISWDKTLFPSKIKSESEHKLELRLERLEQADRNRIAIINNMLDRIGKLEYNKDKW